jgi:hypothetical protein
VALAGEVEAVLEQALVELHDVVEARYGDEQGAAMGARHVLAVALLVSGAGVGEAVVETAVGGEGLEHPADADLGAEAAADLRGIVEDRAHGNAADGLEHVAQALAHALRGFAPEDLREADVRMGEADGEVLAANGDATHLEARLAEVHLALTGQPPERQVPRGVAPVALNGHLPPLPAHVALRGGVAALVVLLLAQTHVDPGRGVALPAPPLGVGDGPCVDRPPEPPEGRELRILLGLRLHGWVPHVAALAHRRLGDMQLPRDPGDGLAMPRPPAHVPCPAHVDHSFLPFSCRIQRHRQR